MASPRPAGTEVTSAYERPKDPERVRRTIISCAKAIASEHGMGAVTVAAVSAMAGVTKGALFHHFASKPAMVEAMFDELIAELDQALDDLIIRDPSEAGRFTRAYITTALTMDEESSRLWSALFNSLIGNAALAAKWSEWLAARLRLHRDTDGTSELEIVRVAADGAWINSISATTTVDLHAIRNRLIAMTLA